MIRAESRAESLRLQGLGIIYLAVLAVLIWASIASYNKVFTDHITVQIDAGNAGSQLNVGGDVRMNGAIIGRVSRVSTGASGARIAIQIDRSDAQKIPRTAVASILPTTLFGQKFVELNSSADPATGPLEDGATLREDPSVKSAELTDVLNRLEPVLTAVEPADLAKTLSALSTGLEGRGQKLGDLINSAGSYLGSLNGLTPEFEHDLSLLSTVSGQYADVAPDLLATTGNLTTTFRTLDQRSGDLADFFKNVTDVSTVGERLLRANQINIAESARLARPTIELLAEYSPELVCVLEGFKTNSELAAAQVIGGSIQGDFTIGTQKPGYTRQDALEFGDLGTGPSCRGLPDPQVPYPAVQLNDGVGKSSANLMGLMLGGASAEAKP